MRDTSSYPLAFLVMLVVCLGSGDTWAQFKERVRTYDVLHYAIAIKIDEKNNRVSGTVTMRLVPLKKLSSFDIDAAEMNITKVLLGKANGEVPEAHYVYHGNTLTVSPSLPINFGDTLAVAVTYSCSPRLGMYFIHPDSAYPDKPVQVWTQGENEDNRYWLPCYDYPNDKATVEMRVTVNEKFIAISNGALLEVTSNREERTRTFSWYSAKPSSSYLISLIVGNYITLTDRYGHIPVEYNVYPNQRDDALRSFGQTVDMMRFFSNKTGFEYPWARYAQTVIADFTYGGMENTSATTLTDKSIHSARAHLDVSSESLVAHELAHQWFGDLLTCKNWSHSWLNEGFATYFQALYVEDSNGSDAYEWEMLSKQRGVTSSDTGVDRRPTVTDNYIDPEQLFDNRIYDRGAAILHMLRFVMGDEKFWEGIRHYVDRYQYDTVTTDDLQHAMEDVAKQDLSWFFSEWTVKAGFPRFAVSSTYDHDLKTIRLKVRQEQQVDDLTPLYRMPVAVEVATARGKSAHKIIVEAKREQVFDLPSEETPLNIVFDKGSWVLKTLDHPKPTEEWLYQLKHGGVAEREASLRQLERVIDEPGVLAEVGRMMESDPFWGIRKQAAEAAGKSKGAAVLEVLATGVRDSVAAVRVAATASLKSVKTLESLVALGNIVVRDSSYAVVAEAITSLVAIDSANGMKYCEKGLSLDSHNEVIRAAAARAMGTLKTVEAKEKLIALTAYGQPLEIRLAAVDALADNWKNDDGVREHLESILSDRIQRVRRRVVEKLGTMASAKSRPVLVSFLDHEIDSLLKREARKSIMLIDRVPNK